MNTYIFHKRHFPAPLLSLLVISLFALPVEIAVNSHAQQQDFTLKQSFIPPGGGNLASAPNGSALHGSIGQSLAGVSSAPTGARLNHGVHLPSLLPAIFAVNAKLVRDFLLGRLKLNDLQRSLLDVNGDGVIDVADHTHLIKEDKSP